MTIEEHHRAKWVVNRKDCRAPDPCPLCQGVLARDAHTNDNKNGVLAPNGLVYRYEVWTDMHFEVGSHWVCDECTEETCGE